jgi:hypothetical protein
MKIKILEVVTKQLAENHDVSVLNRTKTSITIQSSTGIPYRVTYKMLGKIHPNLLDDIIDDETKIKTLVDALLFDLIFIEEVAHGKKSGIKNFKVFRTQVKTFGDIDTVTKTLNEINNVSEDEWSEKLRKEFFSDEE